MPPSNKRCPQLTTAFEAQKKLINIAALFLVNTVLIESVHYNEKKKRVYHWQLSSTVAISLKKSFLFSVLENLPITFNAASATNRNNSQTQSTREPVERVRELLQEMGSTPEERLQFHLKEALKAFTDCLWKCYHAIVQSLLPSSLRITVQFHTLEHLELLWRDYQSGTLKEVAEKCLMTDEIKSKLDVEEVTLKVEILEEDYLACERSLMLTSGVLNKTYAIYLNWTFSHNFLKSDSTFIGCTKLNKNVYFIGNYIISCGHLLKPAEEHQNTETPEHQNLWEFIEIVWDCSITFNK